MPKTIEELIQDQGTAFAGFKASVEEQLKELKTKGTTDPVLVERLQKMEKQMDDAIEAKNAIEARIEAERKEREDLEKRLNRAGVTEASKEALLVADFQKQLNARRKSLGKDPILNIDQRQLDDYKAAQAKMIRYGRDELSPDELKTLQISIDTEGGFLVTPDMGGRIVTKVYESSPIRQIASVGTTGKDKVTGIEDLDEAGCGYSGERTTSGDTTTPTIQPWEIPIASYDTEPKATSDLLDDADRDVEAWLTGKVSDKFARFESNEHVNGVGGANKIRGFLQYDTAADSGAGVAWGSLGFIKTGVNGDFAATNPADKLFDLQGLLKNAYLPNARWVTRRSVITKMRKFKTTTGDYLWAPALTAGSPESFAGHPITRAEDMPALSANGFSVAFGDFREGYQIYDRQGFRVLRDNLTEKPYIKFFTRKRSGGGVLNFEAIKLLQFAA